MSDLMPNPDDFVGAYRIVRPIGKGGMGVVFEAVHTRTGKPAAIKVLHARFTEDTEALSRILAEGRATAKLDHPSIVRILETGQLPSGACYIAMEYLRGETLGKRLKRQGRLGREALHIGAQIAAALVQAHQKNIIHRELLLLKPPTGKLKKIRFRERSGNAKKIRHLATDTDGSAHTVKLYAGQAAQGGDQAV